MSNSKLITKIINSSIIEFTSIVTSHFLDPCIKLILASLDKCFEYIKDFTFVNKKEDPCVSCIVIHYHKPYLFPPMLEYVVGPNKSICNNSNALLVLIMLFLGWVFATCLPI